MRLFRRVQYQLFRLTLLDSVMEEGICVRENQSRTCCSFCLCTLALTPLGNAAFKDVFSLSHSTTLKLVYLTRMRVIRWLTMWLKHFRVAHTGKSSLPAVKEQRRARNSLRDQGQGAEQGWGPGLASYSEKSPRALEQCADANIPLSSLFLLIFSKIHRSILRQQSLKTYRVFQKSKNCPAVWNSFHCINGQYKSGLGSLRTLFEGIPY